MDRPPFVKDAHLKYLDSLRLSGATNMYGARPWIMNAFPDLSKKEAVKVLSFWMQTFGERKEQAGEV